MSSKKVNKKNNSVPPRDNYCEKDQRITDLLSVKRIFEKYDVFFWLEYGAILGAIRDGGFIPWDNDLDIAIWGGDAYKLRKARKELKKAGLKIIFFRNNHYIIINEDYKPGDFFFDIYVYTLSSCGSFIEHPKYPKGGGKKIRLPSHFYDSFSPISFFNEEYNAPSDVEQYLRFLYGDDWETPIKYHEGDSIPKWAKENKFISFIKNTTETTINDLKKYRLLGGVIGLISIFLKNK